MLEPIWTIGARRFYYGLSDEYRIQLYGLGGETVQVVLKEFAAIPVDDGDRRILLGAFGELMEQNQSGWDRC